MPENKLKIGRKNSFIFEGRALVNDNTFTINKTKEGSTWVHSSLNMGIDCGEDHGINYVNLMGGYDTERDNYIYLNTVDENGKIRGKDYAKKIDWEDRLSLTSDDFEEISSLDVINTYIEHGSDGKLINKKFVSAYDAIPYIKEHIKEGTIVKVNGHIDYRMNADGDWLSSHVIDTITVKTEDRLINRANVEITALIDVNTVDSKNVNVEEGTVPLFFKTLTFVRTVDKKKYNQVCGIPVKMMWEFGKTWDLSTAEGKKQMKSALEMYFTVGKKDSVTEAIVSAYYKGGVQKIEPKMEDLPQDILLGIQMGVIDKEQALSTLAINGNAEKTLVFKGITTRQVEATDSEGVVSRGPKMMFTKDKYKTIDIPSFEDLEPIENENVAPVDNSVDIDDEEAAKEVNDILSIFQGL